MGCQGALGLEVALPHCPLDICSDLLPTTPIPKGPGRIKNTTTYYPDPPIPVFFAKKARNPRKKQGFSSPPNPYNPWKREQKRTKKQGKPQNEKSEENEKSKDWRVRVIYYRRINSPSVEIFCELSPGKQGVSETVP